MELKDVNVKQERVDQLGQTGAFLYGRGRDDLNPNLI